MGTDGRDVKKDPSMFRITRFSRRQFLKRTGITAFGAVIGSIALSSGCKSSTNGTTSLSPSTPSSSATASTSSSSNPATLTATGSPYVPQTAVPPLITVAGTSCTVAMDRVYSEDNIWVKSISNSRVVMGITETMKHIVNNPYKLDLYKVGTVLHKGDMFGIVEGYKLTADLITPVSGTVMEINKLATGFVGEDGSIAVLQDPYVRGWMTVVELSNPTELKGLLTPTQYDMLVTGVAE